MSSILDALRRIERESGERRGLPFELPPEDDSPRSRSWRRWVVGGVAIVSIAIVALLSLDRDRDEAGDRASPAPEENAQVAMLAPDESAPAAVRSPAPAAGAAEQDGERGATVGVQPVAPGEPGGAGRAAGADHLGDAEAGPDADVPARAAEVGAAAPDPVPSNPAAEAAGPGDVDGLAPAPGESPEQARRAKLREQTRARREAVKAQLAERRRAQQMQQLQQEQQQAPNDRPAGEPAPARPWQRVVAAPTEAADTAAADAGPSVPPVEDPHGLVAGPSPEDSQALVPPIAKLDAPQLQVAAPPLPAAGAELQQPSAETAPVPGRADDEKTAAPETAATGADIGEPAAPSTEGEAAGAPPEVPADAATETAAVREDEILRRPPRGAPRVRVSFLLYSEDPGRRRVMLTVNDGTDLVTAYEGQRVEALEIARILPDEVHLRYEGKVFAVEPRH
jgi:hypothetical protein